MYLCKHVYMYNIYICIYMYILWNQHLFATKRKKHWINSVNCCRPARSLRTGGRPDHGPKNGATNLEAGFLSLVLRPHFWVRNLSLFMGSQNTHGSCYIELRIGSKERYAGTCAATNAGWQSMILWGYTL